MASKIRRMYFERRQNYYLSRCEKYENLIHGFNILLYLDDRLDINNDKYVNYQRLFTKYKKKYIFCIKKLECEPSFT